MTTDPDAGLHARSRAHGHVCDPTCIKLAAAESPLDRDRPPAVTCPWCAAPPRIACTRQGRRRWPLYGRPHPSRGPS